MAGATNRIVLDIAIFVRPLCSQIIKYSILKLLISDFYVLDNGYVFDLSRRYFGDS